MELFILKRYIRDEKSDSGTYMEQYVNLKYWHNFDHYLKYGNFRIYEDYYSNNFSFLYLIISNDQYSSFIKTDINRTEIFEAFEAILKEEFKNEIRKEKIKQLDMLHNI